jgi:hypothetical protein
MLAKEYWHRVHRLEEAERELDAARRAKFRESNDPAALEGQTMTEGLYMTSLENEERSVTGGSVSAIPWRLTGVKLVDKTHRRATAHEIAEEFKKQEAFMTMARKQEDAMNHRRTITVQNAEPRRRCAE